MRPQISRLVRWACVLGVAAAVLVAVLKTTPGDRAAVPTRAASVDAATVQTDHGPLGPADRDLLAKVRQAGLWEMPTGQDMQQRGSAQRVREVGGLIAGEHADLDQIVRDTAGELGMALPNQPTGQQREWMEQIAAASGADYDRTAVNLLRQAHGKVLPVIAQVRSGTRNDLIRDFATTAAQFVTRHHDYLESTGLVDFAALPEPPGPPAGGPTAGGPTAGGPTATVAGNAEPVPVANAIPTDAEGYPPASTPVEGSTILSATVAVGAVLGAGALLGLMLHTGSRRPGPRARAGATRRMPPPAGWAGRVSPPPVHPGRRHGDRSQAMFALVLAAGLVGTLVFAGRSAPGDTTTVQPAAAQTPAAHLVGGHDHGSARQNLSAGSDGRRPGSRSDDRAGRSGGRHDRAGRSGRDNTPGGGRNRDSGDQSSGGGVQRVNGLEVVGRDCENSDLAPHDGFQEGQRCVGTAAGEVSAAERNPSLLITAAPRRVRAGQPFEMRVSTRNLVRDRFLAAADGGYYLERSELTSQGIQRGHFHTACRMLERTDVAPDPNQEPAAFVATEDGGGGARPDEVTVDVPGLRQRGIAQCAVWAGDGSHRVPMMQRANETPAFDVVRLLVQ